MAHGAQNWDTWLYSTAHTVPDHFVETFHVAILGGLEDRAQSRAFMNRSLVLAGPIQLWLADSVAVLWNRGLYSTSLRISIKVGTNER